MLRRSLALSLAVVAYAQPALANSPCRSEYWSVAWAPFASSVPAGCPIEVIVPEGSFAGPYELRVDRVPTTFTATEIDRWPIARDVMRCGGERCGRLVHEEVEVAIVRFEPATAPVAGQTVTVGDAGAAYPLSISISAAAPCPVPSPWTWDYCGEPDCFETCEDDGGCATTPATRADGLAAGLLLALAGLLRPKRKRPQADA